MDWNEDGMKDLITGERNGFIRIYLNVNTDADPVFDGFTQLQVNSAVFDCGYTSVPYIVDWNNDGMKDVLCGEDSGRIYLLINSGTNPDPVFMSAVFLNDNAAVLDVGSRASPCTVDWNRDGKKDLLVGDTYGYIYFYQNYGSDANPQFNGSVKLEADGAIIDVGSYSRPDCCDWDNDGVMDILCGDYINSTAYVDYFHAMGPLFAFKNELSESAGGTIQLNLKAGAANGNRNYLVLGSVTGTEPGVPLPGGLVKLPLNWDIFTKIVMSLWNTPTFQYFNYTLSSTGLARAYINSGPLPSGSAGIVVHFAYCLYYPYDYVSNPLAIEIIP